MLPPIEHLYRFGEFTLDADQKVLLRGGKPLPLAPKVFDTLIVLVENSGRIATKEELMNRLWPDSFVEESNLTFNIQQLRKSLGDNARKPVYIETVARRGYRFIAAIEEVRNDNCLTPSHSPHQFEASAGYEARAVQGFNGASAAPVSEAVIKLSEPSVHQESPNALVSSLVTSTSRRKRLLALMTALAVLLVGAGLVVGKLSKQHPAGLKKVDGKAPLTPLKIERLTQTGASKLVAISPDGKYLAYTRSIQNRTAIWLRQLSANTNVEIVPAIGNVHGLAFANSGDYLYFAGDGSGAGLYRVSLLGGVPIKVLDKNLEGRFSLSSDDSQIAFVLPSMDRAGQRQYSLMLANSDGSSERLLVIESHPNDIDAPIWSPDDKAIICAYGNSSGGGQNVRIVEIRIADSTKRELSSERFFHINKLAWLPLKSGLIISGRKNDQDHNQLWRLSIPRLELRQMTDASNSYLDLSVTAHGDRAAATQATRIGDIRVGSSREPRKLKKITEAHDKFCWSPSGSIVYASTASGNKDLWIMQPDGTEQRQLTVSAGWNGMPVVTPDNRYIVFSSNRTGARQIWRMNIDGTNQIRLTSGASADSPAISPDGQWVFYNTTDDWRLWKVSINGGEQSRLTDYFASHPAVSPDGKMLACAGRKESKRELMILPIDGGAPLKEFALTGWISRIEWAFDRRALIYGAGQDGATSIFRQPLDGSEPETIVDLDEDELFDFGYSPDGQYLAISRGAWLHDIFLIGDLSQGLTAPRPN